MISERSRKELLLLPEDALARIDSVCDLFETALRTNPDPKIEDYLSADEEAEYRCLLRELLHLELNSDTKRQLADSTQYEARFPADAPVIREVFDELARSTMIVDEYESIPIGTVFADRYKISQLIGAGAVGSVYLAEDLSTVDSSELELEHDADQGPTNASTVALKVLRPNNEFEPEQLLEEARLLGSLNHPNIAKAFDSGVSDGVAFLAMQYIDGPSLAEAIEHGEFRGAQDVIVEGADMLAKIADALDYAHQEGLTHRDVKPHNILLDAERNPCLVDFGFALHETIQHRHNGDRSGTPYYRSPEQVRGQADWIDGRADVWALGVMLYEITTGRRPFVGDTIDEIDRQILGREPKPPRQINAELPSWLEEICLRCLEKSPTHRFSTAGNVAQALRLRGARKRGVPLWMVVPAALIACLVVGLSMWRMRDSVASEGKAKQALIAAEQKRDEQAEHTQRMLESVLRDLVDQLSKQQSSDSTSLKENLIRTSIESIDALAPTGLAGVLYRVNVKRRLANCLLEYEQPEKREEARQEFLECRDILDRALSDFPRHEGPPLHRLMGLVCDGVAGLERRDGDFDSALELFDVAKKHRQTWLEIVQQEPDAIRSTPFAFAARSMPKEAENITELEHAELGVAISNLMFGQLYRQMGRHREAQDCFQNRLDVQRRFFQAHPNLTSAKVEYAGILRDLATTLFSRCEYEQAIEHLSSSIPLQRELVEEARERNDRLYGKQINLAMHLRSMGQAYLWSKKLAEADTQFTEAIQILSVLSQEKLSSVYLRVVDLELAKNLYFAWLARRETDLGERRRSLTLLQKHSHREAPVVLGSLHRIDEALANVDATTSDLGGLMIVARIYGACAWSANKVHPWMTTRISTWNSVIRPSTHFSNRSTWE